MRQGTGGSERGALPPPRLTGSVSLEEALAARRSVRSFRRRRLTAAEISQLLWAVQGVSGPGGDRTAPSAGGLFPLEVYLVTAAGVDHYLPAEHRLERIETGDRRRAIHRAALSQEPLLEAPAIVAIAAIVARTAGRYGRERSPRYVAMEVGHAAQNLLLQAVALGLGAVVIGAFEDEEIRRILGLPAGHRPLYLVPVGEPRAAARRRPDPPV